VAKKHQLKILQDLLEVEAFENFLHIKFPGTKRFSIEGGAGAISCLEETIMELSELGVEEVVIGMAHRGRLSSITKVIGKPYVGIFAGFNGISSVPAEIKISSDVKYHLGASALRALDNGKQIKLSLTYNPSHLEAVNPVTTGKVRAKQEKIEDRQRNKVVCLLIHGDAAFAGQGVVAETLSFAELEGFNVGGTIHLVINNQVGFTANPQDARAGRYPTEVAKIINAPIFHINGNDPQALKKASMIAANFRHKFKKDIVIDVTCYRLYGHNEGDEPLFTQPLMYKEIAKQKPLFELYGAKLISQKVLTPQQYQEMLSSFRAKLDDALAQSKDYVPQKADCFEGSWQGFTKGEEDYEEIYQTGINLDLLTKLGLALTNTPDGFSLNAKIQRQLEAKVKMIQSAENIDWSLGEALAYATLLWDGYKIRLCGQDSGRGTFSHRHAVLIDQLNETNYIPLNNIDAKASFEVIDSNLSEFGVLGFEYGYSQADPRCLNIWEGQFGDFANGAQVIIDQFIASAEQKWLRFSGLVMLLPHGFEGQGPEHSSARLERFLQLCAQENIQVANCTTPASFFHLLRRQMKRNYRKPLIIMTPKSLLRHKLATSSLVDFADNTHFKTIIGDNKPLIADDKVNKVILCSGKVYYDLYEYREKSQKNDVAIIRIEQYYPFPTNSLAKELYKYKNAQIIWVQEEPKNMGAWTFIKPRVNKVLQESEIVDKYFRYIGRKDAASPAVGYLKIHNQEQEDLIKRAFN
jgi:2-oxoglutarate dehydrogenase E1 component